MRTDGWIYRACVNDLGCLATATVLVVVVAEKTAQGAWIVLLVIPAFVVLFRAIDHYYSRFDTWDAEGAKKITTAAPKSVVVVLVSRLRLGARKAIAFARIIDPGCHAVHVSIDDEQTEKLIREFRVVEPDLPIEVRASPLRSLVYPVSEYVQRLRQANPDEIIMIVMPELIVGHWWERLLHHNSATLLRWCL